MMDLGIAGWKYDKEWVYSVTYDEALSELHRFVIPVHDRLGIPGHLEVVSGHIGKVRNLGASSFNGLNHMTGSELRDMMKRGWGVGCHSYSHIRVMDDPERELKLAKMNQAYVQFWFSDLLGSNNQGETKISVEIALRTTDS